MPAQTYGYSTTSIKWDFEQTEVDESSVDFVAISCVGYMKEDGATLTSALIAVPTEIEISDDGPVKLSTELTGSRLDTRSASFSGDGRIEVRCVYKISASVVFNEPDGGTGSGESASDRYDLRVEVEDVPILSHPVAMEFPGTDKNKLKNLLEGDIVPNPKFEEDGDTKEFIYAATIGEATEGSEAVFGTDVVTVDGISASPVDYARIIRAGIETYRRPAVRWLWQAARDTRPDNNELNSVGDIENPPQAPDIAQDRDWLYNGVHDVEEAPEAHTTSREFILSERGGALKEIYKGGTGSINNV